MNQPENKPKLSDVARQTNADKASKFSASMIPKPPMPRPEVPADESALPPPSGQAAEEPSAQVPAASPRRVTAEIAPVAKASRPRRTTAVSAISIDDVISPESPKGEPYPRQVRIAETHHDLLRRIAFKHRKTMNHVLYNLLELLDQADQREQQKDA